MASGARKVAGLSRNGPLARGLLTLTHRIANYPVDSVIHRISHYPAHIQAWFSLLTLIHWILITSIHGGQCYPASGQLGP